MSVFVGICQHGQPPIACIECYRLALAEEQDKVRSLELQVNEFGRNYAELIDAARTMVKHMADRHELSSCCHDFSPTPAYLLKQALTKHDAKQRCPSTHQQGKFKCEKDAGHLQRCGDVPHTCGDKTWLSI